jgi:hypothetical protein
MRLGSGRNVRRGGGPSGSAAPARVRPTCRDPYPPDACSSATVDMPRLSCCYVCGADLAQAPTRKAEPRTIAFQRHLERVAESGHVSLPPNSSLDGPSYFSIVHQIARIVATGPAAKPLQAALWAAERLPPLDRIAFRGGTREIEVLRPEDRHRVLASVAFLMNKWPEHFVGICRSQGVWSAAVLRDMNAPPFAFWEPVMGDLYRASYAPNDTEIRAAMTWLSKASRRASVREATRYPSTDSQSLRTDGRLKKPSKKLLT